MIGGQRPLKVEPLWPARQLALAVLGGTGDWQDQGACRDADYKLFDPASENEKVRPYPARAAIAASYCWSCPVRAACNQAAWDNGESGVWGGFWHRDARAARGRNVAHRATAIAPRAPAGNTEAPTRKAG